MYTSADDDQKFGREFLDQIIEWIIERFDPEEIYGEKKLIEYVNNNYSPGDIFDEAELIEAITP